MYRIESKVRYNIALRSDLKEVVIKAFHDNGLIGDGVTELSDADYNGMYKNNMNFMDKCISRGSFIVKNIPDVKAPKELPKTTKKGKKAKEEETVVEEVKEEPTSTKEELVKVLKEQEESKVIATSDDIPKTDMSEADNAIGV